VVELGTVQKASWSRDQKLALTGCVVGGIIAIAIGVSAYFVPEVRQFLHLDKPTASIQATTPLLGIQQANLFVQNTEPPKQEPFNTKPQKSKLFIDCYSIGGYAVLPAEGIARILDLQEMPESFMKVDYLEETSGKRGAEFAGKDINGLPINVAECHITSYISGPIFNITATPHVTFQEAIQKSANASESGKVTLSRDWPIKIPKIDSGPDHPYVFYVMNESNRFVSLSFPDRVTASVLGKNERRPLQLITGKKLALRFSPIK
jgi:hypothetical protein